MNNDNSIRMLAEWEPQEAIIMALPHEDTDWAYMLDEVHQCYKDMARAIVESGEKLILLVKDKVQATELFKDIPMDNILMVKMPTNDTWTRDYGVISIDTPDGLKAIDFGFNGWGLKFASCHDNLANLRLCDMGLFPSDTYRNLRGYICEGGSLETDGQGTLLTTTECLCSPNRNGGLSKEEVEQVLSRELGFTRYLWLDHGYLAGDDTDSHIDTLARICPNDTIVFVGCRDIDDEHFEALMNMRMQLESFTTADGRPYRLLELPMADAMYDEDGERLPATYVNYLVLNDRILLPTYNQPDNDRAATEIMRLAYPGYQIVGIDCSALVRQHGSLHCSTMQIPQGLLYL